MLIDSQKSINERNKAPGENQEDRGGEPMS